MNVTTIRLDAPAFGRPSVCTTRLDRVRIDGIPVGKIAEGETKDFFVPPGEHRVRLTMGRPWTSREVILQLHEGGLAEFTRCPSASTTASVVLMWVRPHRWIRLDGPVVTYGI